MKVSFTAIAITLLILYACGPTYYPHSTVPIELSTEKLPTPDKVERAIKITDSPLPVAASRQQVLKDYITYLDAASALRHYKFNGNKATCDEGNLSDLALKKIENQINYFRKAVGVDYDIKLVDSLNKKVQKMAFIIDVNNKLSHYPDSTWSCYSEDAALAGRSSNLSKGRSIDREIKFNMDDPGVGNEFVGHRRWLLSSKALYMGYGRHKRGGGLWIKQSQKRASPIIRDGFIAWPNKGYVMNEVFGKARWSFGIPKADFTNATVTMVDSLNNPIPLKLVGKEKWHANFADQTMVWDPNITRNLKKDTKFTVTVSNVKVNSEVKSYTYSVTFINNN